MIVGIGVDIVDNRRIKKILMRFGTKFKERCFSNIEIKKSESRSNEINTLSKRYAAKEACAKALGTGLARGVFWRDIEVLNNNYGKPYIKLYNNALKRLNELSDSNCRVEVSLSDEKNYSIANVIIYKNE